MLSSAAQLARARPGIPNDIRRPWGGDVHAAPSHVAPCFTESPTMKQKSVAMVSPCYNEKGNLRETHRRVSQSVARAGLGYEFVYVDDGSHDSTPEMLRDLQAE